MRANIGTPIDRIFNWGGSSLKKIKHVIEPELNYFFIPHTRQRDIPILEGIDRINRRNFLTFSLTNRHWVKFGQQSAPWPADEDVELLNAPPPSDVRELARLKLALSYDLDKERNGGDRLSDLDLNLRLTPTNYFRMAFDGGLNPGPWQFTHATVSFGLLDPRPLTRSVLDPQFM